MRAMVALLALVVGGWWRLPLTGASGGAAAVCRAAASAAAAGTRFQRAYAIASTQQLGALAAATTPDGGFLLAGIAGNSYNTSDFYLMKTDAAGNVLWNRTYNVLQQDGGGLPPEGGRALDLVPTPDGGFLLAGSTCCYGGKAVAEVLRIDGSGDVLWNKTYRSPSVSISIRRAVAASDGDFLLIGHSGPDATSYKMFAAKIGPDGTLRWSRIYDVIVNALDLVRDAAPTPDGGALLVGQLFQAGVALAFTIDGDGNVGWARWYGQEFYGYIGWEANTVVRLPGGDFVLAGFAYDLRGLGRGGPWVMRIDSSGNVSWAEWGPSFSEGAGRIVPLSDGNLLLAGTDWFTDFPDMVAAKMTPTGEVLWRRRYGRAYGDSPNTAAATPDGGFLLAGWSNDPGGKQDLYTVRADATGSSGCLEQDLPTGVTPIDLNTLVIGTPPVEATDVALVVETLAPSVGAPASHSAVLCSDAMAWRLYLPLVLR